MTSALCEIDWTTVGIWVSAAMELAVAVVILYEVEQHRRAGFLEEASREEHLKEKRDIYSLFLETAGTTADEKSEAFCRSLWERPDLRSKCDTQLVLFNKLGYLLTPRPISWVVSNESVLQWHPQSVVLLWLILAPYIQKRREKLGKWWAGRFENYTEASVKFLLSESVEHLEMYHPERSDTRLTINKDELQELLRSIRGK
jgi:hypothetical protein